MDVVFAGLVCLAAAVACSPRPAITSGSPMASASGRAPWCSSSGWPSTSWRRNATSAAWRKLLVNERVLGAALSNRLKELAMLYEAGKAMNSVLVMDEVLQPHPGQRVRAARASAGRSCSSTDKGGLAVVCRAGDARAPRIELAGDRQPGGP